MNCSPYIVDNSNDSNYKTVQSAIDTAKENGGGVVYIQPGVYQEDLKLFDNVDLCGAVGIADTQTCTIIGTHSPPKEGHLAIRNICLKSNKSVFFSEEIGTASIFLNSCFLGVQNGYVFELPNWKAPGKFVAFDLGDADSKDNGFIKNHYGASTLIVAATLGQGSKKMQLSGDVNFFTVQPRCSIILEKSANAFFASGCSIERTVEINDESKMNAVNSCFRVQNEPAIVFNSSKDSLLSEVSIDCNGTLTIEGNGSGLLSVGSITTIKDFKISDSLRISYCSFSTGDLFLRESGKGLNIREGENSRMGTIKLASGKAYVSTIAIKEESRIFLTTQKMEGNFGALTISKKDIDKGFEIISSSNRDNSVVAWMIVNSC